MSEEIKPEMTRPESLSKELEEKLLNPEELFKKLSVEQQYMRIVSKAAQHPEAIIPKPTTNGEGELMTLIEESKESGRPLSIKLGVDATGPNIHIGHAISLLMLRRFQWMGHKIKFIVGDFTGRVGDPSGRLTGRDVLSEEQVKKNVSTYAKQASRVIDLNDKDKVGIFYNSEWLSKMTMADWLPILQRISGNLLLQREDFTKRLQAGGAVSAAEMFYPLFMAYDSVQTQPDIELGGVDQLLNLHWCRELMKLHGQKRELFIMMDLLPGTTGEVDDDGNLVKMSKSKNNYIMVTEKPEEMYGKVMSISDDLMWIWYRELTEISPEEITQLKKAVEDGKIHPMEAKRLLARVVVGTFNHYDQKLIGFAEKSFNQKFGKQKKLVPDDVQNIESSAGERIIDLLSKATGESKSNIKKMTSRAGSSGVKVLEGNRYKDITTDELVGRKLTKGEILVVRFGKRRYYKIST